MPAYAFTFPLTPLLMGVGALLLTACAKDTTEQTERGGIQPKPVIAAQITYSPEQVNVEAVGTSRAVSSVAIRPRVSGQVVAVKVAPGQTVAAGDVLFELDNRNEGFALRNAQVELDDAKRLLRRYRQTKDSGAVTQSAIEDAESAVARAQIAVERAEVELEYRSVLAPFAGIVGLTDTDSGAWVDTNTTLTTLDDRNRLLVTFVLPELLLGEISVGQSIEMSTWRKQTLVASGKVVEIDSRVDADERTFKVRAHVPNPDDRLRPGMSFRISLTLTGNEYALVPELALQWGPRGSFVWVIVDGVAERRVATIVQRRAGKVLVDTQLPDGALVVLEGIQMVREGLPVSIAKVVDVEGVPVAMGGVEVSGE
ncbi:efflux RND transporter periplasmic adaptor subunit [Gilvimarinus sp. SDUM040013]|uniref:Efflux RND transporter periplasmic adaptor subunit n=1 Tax=Gilvimarinus gilvus TaxID=3058038 RepID=A0ABU4RXR0_9GAMM|nr:efflux RND transporter periplasmic adaptor subunit [Gilvimarinus sp. SDUM040013]MDO3388199.1 efflux RND transporter periplasmic adaptor subunit [Gilvimarinus sp. SDUM040013]MDX6847749.1 efflux RND transporter periplasmic adaptor subunit [Gilvimarinus sp. SDUM040013]